MSSSMCQNPSGTRLGSWFRAILYHMSTAYLNDQDSERHFERLSAGSSAQNYVHLAMTAAAEIVVEGCSRVLLGLLTTDKPDSYVIV